MAYVYTPQPLRRRGYASAVVAELSQRELDAGQSWCSLFTDADNPTSNHIYTEIGYEPRCDFRIPECARALPRLVEVATGHWARCPVINSPSG